MSISSATPSSGVTPPPPFLSLTSVPNGAASMSSSCVIPISEVFSNSVSPETPLLSTVNDTPRIFIDMFSTKSSRLPCTITSSSDLTSTRVAVMPPVSFSKPLTQTMFPFATVYSKSVAVVTVTVIGSALAVTTKLPVVESTLLTVTYILASPPRNSTVRVGRYHL